MRKLLLGMALLAVSRAIARGAPLGWRRLLSLRGVAGAVAAGAAGEMLGRRRAPSQQKA